ncbi:MAG: tetratricopeptide repeat protein [Planctomycetes bacterium]|nr:tetratricopeptide repeat protein [Planctomycetota bacterium]
MPAGRTTRAALRTLPLALTFAVAAWPFVLWLVHRVDAEAAVRTEQTVVAALKTGAWLLGGLLLVGLAVPLARAFLRLHGSRIWLSLSQDMAPLLRAQSELRHFESGARHFEVGRLARLRRRDDLALVHLQRAVELEAGAASHWHWLGLAQFDHGDWTAAAESFRRAEALDPGHAFGGALLLRGRALHLLGAPEALALLAEHGRRHGGSPKSHVWLAEAYTRAGDAAAARTALGIAAAPPRTKLSAEENWFRAIARMRTFGRGGPR